MPHEVIMPALGMAQDTGLLVNWLKAPGEAVSLGDPLFEVETDKSTMEVEAPADGFLTDLKAEAGAEIPVGQIIALISDTAEGEGLTQEPSDFIDTQVAEKVDAEPTAAIPTHKVADPPVGSRQNTNIAVAPVAENERILASPKARRLAHEAGLDLNRLVLAGHPQPYHVADIEVLRTLPKTGSNAATSAHLSQITACVPRTGTDDFLNWMLEDGGITIAPTALWASFASGALRSAMPDTVDLIIALSNLTGVTAVLKNPDKTRLLHQMEVPDSHADLVLRDMTDSPITGLRLGPPDTPVLSVASDRDMLRLSLEFTSDQLESEAAIALISGFAERLADPLQYLI
ncbi:dihydrolipoamide acetyltransferase [Ruegeria sp. R13_0]|uniref:biotin/lipoyl-containing protein n=1 Tax=Ruegeria sp. R13_0 TaxID=2821099 RepID=UPI001ADBD82C|nr:biotin/lipoyl-containing protein [Ruegeria sp. R13_0]MBO9435090.1 dihydrolipoamide acetyltransferase [Ruegeria sp. R13_0]